jgi:hypothetical protein
LEEVVLFAVRRSLIDAFSLGDAGGRHGWQCGRAWLHGTHDPRGL